MPERCTPPPLRAGDRVRVIAPSRSLRCIEEGSPHGGQSTLRCVQRLEAMGLQVEFGAHVRVNDRFNSSSVAQRLEDLHAAFADPGVAGILTVIGGYNSNELLPHIDWALIKAHPKTFCGYSDISALSNAMWAHTGLVTWSGPHFSTFGMRDGCAEIIDGFRAALFGRAPMRLDPCPTWSCDNWFLDQDARTFVPNPGIQVLNPGRAQGPIVGANLSTFALLLGTPHMPSLAGCVLFVEALADPAGFVRLLESVLQQPGGDQIAGLVIGRFQPQFKVTAAHLQDMVAARPQLQRIPVVAGLDFGHTTPLLPFPIGGIAHIDGDPACPSVQVRAG